MANPARNRYRVYYFHPMARDEIPVRLSGIPSQYREGFLALHRLSEEQAKELTTALDQADPRIDSSALATTISQNADSIQEHEIKEVVAALLSLSSLQADLDTSVPSVAEAVARMMTKEGSEEPAIPEPEREKFKERLAHCLHASALEVAGKARNLVYEHENVLQDARIMTDIRAVFGESTEEPPKGAMIVHTLKLSFLNDNQLKEIFVALDRDDVTLLREALERAESKAKSLRSILPTDVPNVDTKERRIE